MKCPHCKTGALRLKDYKTVGRMASLKRSTGKLVCDSCNYVEVFR